jgi:hypothetical protein
MLPEFHKHRVIEWEMYVDETSSKLSTYDMIIGRDLMESIGLDLLFSENLMRWDNATVPMRDNSLFREVRSNPYNELLSMHDPVTTGLKESKESWTSNMHQQTSTRWYKKALI